LTETTPALKTTPLIQFHRQARLTSFGGWQMPVQYGGITAEHQAVRQNVGMFDISHMGKFSLQGKNLAAQLQALLPSDLSHLQPGTAKYSVFLNPLAGIIDDLIFYSQAEDRGLLIVNAATTAKDWDWLLQHLDLSRMTLQDISLDQTLIALQGPQAENQLQPLVDLDLSSLAPYHHSTVKLLGHSAWLARTGYTGEDGFEIMAAPELGQTLWQSLIQAGVTPCGLGARDTLRLEAAMGLYGQDMDEMTTPLEAGLSWVVTAPQPWEFIGAIALEQQRQQGVKRRLVGLEMQGRNIARHGYPILFQGQPVGAITSGTLSPTLGKAIALGYIPTHLSQPGQALEVEIRGKAQVAQVVKRPFYRRPKSS
jgi:aminomethyltransferase